MTRKFIYSDKSFGKKDAISEFLIPDIYNNTTSLIGLDSLTKYKFGCVVYTGIELDVAILYEKVKKKKPIGIFKRKKVKRILYNYLTQIKSFKVGDKIKLTGFNKIEKIHLKKEMKNGSK